jgi:hypothetical protein
MIRRSLQTRRQSNAITREDEWIADSEELQSASMVDTVSVLCSLDTTDFVDCSNLRLCRLLDPGVTSLGTSSSCQFFPFRYIVVSTIKLSCANAGPGSL